MSENIKGCMTSYHMWTMSSYRNNYCEVYNGDTDCYDDTTTIAISRYGHVGPMYSLVKGSVEFNPSWRNTSSTYNLAFYPVVYLKNTVKITGGTGTSSNPYTLGI